MINKIAKKERMRKKEKEDISKKYWKMNAGDRLHYDSRRNDIERKSYTVGNITISLMKDFLIIIPLFLVLVGFYANTLDLMIPLIFKLARAGINLLPFILLSDVIFSMWIIKRNEKYVNELNKRFKLIK